MVDESTAAETWARIESRLEREDFSTAEEEARRAIERMPESNLAQELLGRALFGQGRQEEAVDAFEAAIAIDGERADSHIWLGRSLAERIDQVPMLGRLPVAQRLHAAFLRAAELEPQRPAVHLALARFYSEAPPFAGGNPEKARYHVDRLLQLDPPSGHRNLAGILEREEKLEEAEREYLRALEVGPEDLESFRAAGDFFLRQQRPTRALETFESALEIDPEDLLLLLSAGRLLQGEAETETSDPVRAEELLRRIVAKPREQILPSEAAIWSEASWWLGQILEERGEFDGACEAFRAAAEEPAAHPPAEESLRALEASQAGALCRGNPP